MMDNKDDKKLEWMYKNANSLVDREEYLLGRSVDKTLEQLNAEEKEKKFVLPTPKNHVEHECIPPSIRDFNKIVQSEQVDLSAKLQEDPLVAIKKREEEARRQFLQNPVQLKKLQEALKAQQEKKKKKKRKKSKNSDSDSDLDTKIAEKLKLLKTNQLGAKIPAKSKKKIDNNALDTILMHKFNALKDKLSEEDLQDILKGKISSDSEEEIKKIKKRSHASSSDSSEPKKSKKNKKNRKEEGSSSSSNEEDNIKIKKNKKAKSKKKKIISSCSSEEESDDNTKPKKDKRKKEIQKSGRTDVEKIPKKNLRHSVSNESNEDKQKKEKYNRGYGTDESRYKYTQRNEYTRTYRSDNGPDKDMQRREREHKSNKRPNILDHQLNKSNIKFDEDSDLDRKIVEKLKLLRQEVEEKRNVAKILGPEKPAHLQNRQSPSEGSSDESDSDSESDHKPKIKSFGLVTSSGKKIALKKTEEFTTNERKCAKIEKPVFKPDRNKSRKLTEEEKEKMRREMMTNAIERDRDREETVKRYREKVKMEEEAMKKSDFNKEFVYQELRRSTKDATVEERIRSKLNNIQRSSKHMDSNFSKR